MIDWENMISKLSPERLARYLTIHNWVEIDSLFEGKVRQFLNPQQNDAILLPTDNSFSDYQNIMYRFLCILAEEEKESLKGLYNKLVNPSCDILKWRIADENTFNGAIPFSSMGSNIDYIRDMLGSACLDILNPSPYHAKLYTNDVQTQLKKYSFGQTEIGSYILNILCPLGFYQYQLFDPNEETLPLSRRINLNVLRNIDKIQHSVLENSQEMRDNVAEGNISVNFLTSLSNLYEENMNSNLTISAAWNSTIPFLEGEPISTVQLQPCCIDKVGQTIEEFTQHEEQNVEVEYVGKIVSISTDAEIDDREKCVVKLATIGDNLRTTTILATLSYADFFNIADSAFQTGANVKVKGTKTTTFRSTKLSNARLEII